MNDTFEPRPIEIDRHCGICNGDGWRLGSEWDSCDECDGTGTISVPLKDATDDELTIAQDDALELIFAIWMIRRAREARN